MVVAGDRQNRPVVIIGAEELHRRINDEFGPSPRTKITQNAVNNFAKATGDHQWIHVDPERAAAGPFGTTIAHGYLTSSLGPVLLPMLLDVQGFSAALNYGSDKVRYITPVPVDSMVYLRSATKVNKESTWQAELLIPL